MAIKEIHGDILNEDSDDITFESKWYNQNQLTDAFKKWAKEEYPYLTDAQISAAIEDNLAGIIKDIFKTIIGTIDGDTMTINGDTYTKQGGGSGSGGGGGGGTGSWKTVDISSIFGTNIITDIAYGNGKFVAVGNNDGKIAYSSNGVSWTAANAYTTGSVMRAVAWGSNKFTAFLYGPTSGPRPMYSPDGGNGWTVLNTIGGTGQDMIEANAYGGDKFVAVGGRGRMAYSSDGTSWTAIPPGTGAGASTFTSGINGIAYGGGKFVAVGYSGKMAYSSNGTSWTAVTNTTFGTSHIEAIAYGGGRFVAVGSGSKTAWSDDGVTWHGVTATAFNYQSQGSNMTDTIYAIAYGNGKFVAGGGAGITATSADGTSWTRTGYEIFGKDKDGDVCRIEAIAFGNGVFVAGGQNGKMAYLSGN
jgi:hypothetical protein